MVNKAYEILIPNLKISQNKTVFDYEKTQSCL